MDPFFIGIENSLADLGPWGAVLALVLMATVSVLPFPAEAPAMINGMLFGPVYGTAITFLGALCGATISFELARSVGRRLATRFVKGNALSRVDEVVNRVGWSGLLIARLLPVVAFTALNWGSGLTAVPRARFLWTTAVGILPGVVLFTVFGSAAPVLFNRHPAITAAASAALIAIIIIFSMRASGASNSVDVEA